MSSRRLNLNSVAQASYQSLPAEPSGRRIVAGFDGVLDVVQHLVSERNGPGDYQRARSIDALADELRKSSRQTTSCIRECVTVDSSPGGHTAFVGQAADAIGYQPKLIGTYGAPPTEAFRTTFRESDMLSIGEPATATVIEFSDAKFELTDVGPLSNLTWSGLTDELDLETLVRVVDGASALSTGIWGQISGLPSIWRGLQRDVWPQLSDPPEVLLVDPGDVAKFDETAVATGLSTLQNFERDTRTVLSANHGEIRSLCKNTPQVGEGETIDRLVSELAATFEIDVVGHTRESVTMATGDDHFTSPVPYTDSPTTLNGAGDVLNAGLVVGIVEGLTSEEAVVCGISMATSYVESGEFPTYERFLDGVSTMAG